MGILTGIEILSEERRVKFIRKEERGCGGMRGGEEALHALVPVALGGGLLLSGNKGQEKRGVI